MLPSAALEGVMHCVILNASFISKNLWTHNKKA